MKIDTSKITNNVAIHCPKKEYVRPLFEAMGWEDVDIAWADNCENVYWKGGKSKRGWLSAGRTKYCTQLGMTVIPFTDLIIPESNLIKALHAVRPDLQEWLHEDVEFRFYNWDDIFVCKRDWENEYGIFNGSGVLISAPQMVWMFAYPERIKPIPRWTPEEQEDAERDKFRFNYVTKDKITTLWNIKPKWDNKNEWFYAPNCDADCITIPDTDYPSLQPGECVSLEEIAGGGE